ncbi:MAG: hypothetical protein AAF922_09310 [Pseudomonadota bacterium]
MKWLDALGALGEDYRNVDDLDWVRRTPSLQLTGSRNADVV